MASTRTLQIVVNSASDQNIQSTLERLGHHVVGCYPSTEELIEAIPTLAKEPHAIITNRTEPDQLRRIRDACVSRHIQVPIIILSNDLIKLEDCVELEFVFGACRETEQLDIDMRAVLFVAMMHFKKEKEWRFKAEKALQAEAEGALIKRAQEILFDRHKLPTMEAAVELLQKISASFGRPKPDQALQIIKADAEMRPKESERKKTTED